MPQKPTEDTLEMEQPVPFCFLVTHPTLSTVTEPKLRTNLLWLLPGSQELPLSQDTHVPGVTAQQSLEHPPEPALSKGPRA